MSDVVIQTEELGKSYQIGHQRDGDRYTALRDVLASQARSVWSATRRAFRGQAAVEGQLIEEFWALRDVSFEVKHGEVVGIIGRNGAGKSTLLKILSRITEPTEGRVTLHGRVASLLEVGTGFHPELTGRENIFLNGAILGMTRAEIRRKFDEIVAFAEIERFLDTPVKRYSSGMYVRLAFAVAAHLEPEILLIDEVLAVGDADFQKKCLGKMEDVSQGGRTVLFVSHNMAAVSSLTKRSVVFDSGRVEFIGPTLAAIQRYAQSRNSVADERMTRGRGAHTAILQARFVDGRGNTVKQYTSGDPIFIDVLLETDGAPNLSLELMLRDLARNTLALASLHQFHGLTLPRQAGAYRTCIELKPLLLASGMYTFDITTSITNHRWDHYWEDAIEFEVLFANPGGRPWDFKQSLGYGSFAICAESDPLFVPVPMTESDSSLAQPHAAHRPETSLTRS
jgi:lipopolysaccharide transport system ATP-binding protein